MTTDDHLDGIETSATSDEDRYLGLDELEALPCDPDPARDLGYELTDWERLHPGGETATVFLPATEERLLEEAFIVVEESALCELRTHA
jgi:hypothetical protein